MVASLLHFVIYVFVPVIITNMELVGSFLLCCVLTGPAESWVMAAEDYKRDHSANYFTDYISVHDALGLTVRHGSAVAIATLVCLCLNIYTSGNCIYYFCIYYYLQLLRYMRYPWLCWAILIVIIMKKTQSCRTVLPKP